MNKEKFIPYIIETSAGCDRTLLMFLCDAMCDDTDNDRFVLKLNPILAPVKCAVLPLMKKEPLMNLAGDVYNLINDNLDYNIQLDTAGSIGKRYRRQDEIGTPLCITVDFDSLDNKTVTVRHRDTMIQERVPMAGLKEYLQTKLNN